MSSIFRKAAASALRGGAAGAIAMVLQVVLLMWLRTVINYQYRHGGTIAETFRILYREGGILRFYQGAAYALLQGPLSRFGDTAANEGMKELLAGRNLSVGVVTACASMAAALWRIVLTPVDTLKTTLQVQGASGITKLYEKVTKFGVLTLYDGAVGNWSANMVGHYPWFVVNNQLEKLLPAAATPRGKLLRRAFIGFCSSVVSDVCSNGVRVVKTYKQTSDVPLSYRQALEQLIAASGIVGFLVRGLGVKLFSNALSSILFSVLWKMIMERFQKKGSTSEQGGDAEQATTSSLSKKETPSIDGDDEMRPLMLHANDGTETSSDSVMNDALDSPRARRRIMCNKDGNPCDRQGNARGQKFLEQKDLEHEKLWS